MLTLTDEQRSSVIACCRDLVQVQSLPGREAEAAQVVTAWMHRLGYDTIHTDTYGNVIGRITGQVGAGPHLHFDGHIDTVPATALEAWQHPPFAADIADGAIWGRGSTDMKGPLAAMLCAVAFTPRSTLRGTLTISASVAEEELEGPALVAILENDRPDYVIIGETNSLQLTIGHKGRAGIRITTHGTPAHSSVPAAGENAIYRMLEVTQLIRAIPAPNDDLLGIGVNEMVEIISSPYPGTSIIPDRCTTRWDRRLVRGETRESVLADIHTTLSHLPYPVDVAYLDVQVTCYTGAVLQSEDFHPAWAIDPDHTLARAARAALTAAGLPPTMVSVPYCTNGTGSAGKLGIPSIILGPGDPTLLHVIDEHITIEQLTRGVEVYRHLIDQVQQHHETETL